MFGKFIRIFAALIALTLFTGSAFAQATDSATKTTAKKAAKTPKSKLVDINSASKEELDALPGIGAAYSQKIIDGRPYTSKRQLLMNNIIPQATYDGVKDQIVAHRPSSKKEEKGSALVTPKK